LVRRIGLGDTAGRLAPAKAGRGKPAAADAAPGERPVAGAPRWHMRVALATVAAVMAGALALYGIDGVRENLWGFGALLAIIAGFGKIVRAVYCLARIFTGWMSLRDLRRR